LQEWDVFPDRVVVKQALPRLRVEDEWLAKRERAINEARAAAGAHHHV
jgi:hypothetical protein